ncbi:MAG: hypothetical protein JNM56_07565 [Planctomycetia bacterium]|nr:hypothetical protein [Planctomycetia bacterium]
MTLQAPAQRGVLRRKRLVPVAPAPGVDGRERPSPTRTPCLVSQPPTTAPGALPAQREAQEVEGGRPFPALLVRRRSPKVQQPSFVRMESRPLALQPLRQQRLHPLGVLPPLAAADESSSLGV